MLEIKLSEKEKLALIRRQKGISQAQLAKAIGLHQSSLSYFERGHTELKDDKYEDYKTYILNY